MNSFRLDRFLTLYFFHPLLKILPKSKEPSIPILMYHSISNDRIKKISQYYETSTSPYVFAQHMKYLYENGYQVVNLQEAIDCFLGVKTLKEKTVVITFDDGFRDFYTEAFPVLNSYGFSATVFLPTAFIKNNRLKFKEKECLSWDEMRKLQDKGIIFGSHTVNHPVLYKMTMNDIEYELKHSKKKIDKELGISIESFSYPYAYPEHDKKFSSMLNKILEKCRYSSGVTTRIGTVVEKDRHYSLKRIPVNSYDDRSFFKAKLEGGYDWLYRVQISFKLFIKYKAGLLSLTHRSTGDEC